jgi:tryptophanyl-tRNA synthetase
VSANPQARRILSGIRPTGPLHLGNYHGALRNWVELQYQYECYFFVADWHMLTTGYEDTTALPGNIRQVLIDFPRASILASRRCSYSRMYRNTQSCTCSCR